MKKHIDIGSLALSAISHGHTLEELDLGQDATLKKRGLTLQTKAWNVSATGHLCIMRMQAPFGIMRMETVIFAPTHVDAPLFNIDWMSVPSKEIQVAELYDIQVQPWPAAYQDEFARISAQFSDLNDSEHEEHWYDEVLYPCSCHKTGRGVSERLNQMSQEYLASYAAQLFTLPACNEDEKGANVRAFAERLFAEGGPAVDMVTKLFGEEVARRVIVHHMYGVTDA